MSLELRPPQAPPLSHPHSYSLSISPLEQRNEVLPGNAEPLTDCRGDNLTFPPQLVQYRRELVQRLPSVVTVSLHCLDLPAGGSEPQNCKHIPAPRGTLHLRNGRW